MRRSLIIFVWVVAISLVSRCVHADIARNDDADSGNPIDEFVFASLQKHDIPPSEQSTDTEFLRRLSLTTIGQLPTPAEVRAFVADSHPDKRDRKIDELLRHDLHAAVWATEFCELTGSSSETLAGADDEKIDLAQMWHEWLRVRFAQNQPYDELVRAIVTATSRGESSVSDWIDEQAAITLAAREGTPTSYADRASLDLFWRRSDVEDKYPTREVAERIASRFMGVRINCARCHDHPFDQWTQEDYRGFSRIFERVRYGMSPELRREVAKRIQQRREALAAGDAAPPALPRLTEVYLADVESSFADVEATPLGGPPLDEGATDPRIEFADWLTHPENEFFARNFVNRVWDHYFGRGLVAPLDGHSVGAGGAHSRLLDELATRFVASGYDIRQLERMVLTSRTWQLSSRAQDADSANSDYLARARVRIPSPAVVVDMWHGATGIDRDYGIDKLGGLKAVELGSSRLPNSRWDRFLRLFGQTGRTETCDCTPKGHPTIRQTLVLMSDPQLLTDISGGHLQQLLASELSDAELVDELFLRTVSRWPTDSERTAALDACAVGNRGEKFEDILWGLLNTQEFLTIH
ncbi:DUF1549 and DUF1553 domain-containing protein [Aeoliella sp.]|uniref:DUF1549 and DUF1553 domain-containing protein n=1 Tax=Aeoliella sp. TaxID=2795800 RepID=UPI003CCC3D09